MDTPFFQDRFVTVTKARAFINGTTYAMANITSVQMLVQPKPAGLAFLAVLLMLAGMASAKCDASPGVGVSVAAVGAVLLAVHVFVLKTKYLVRIGTAGAEATAVWSYDPRWTQEVVEAINAAIVRRG